MSFKNLFDSLIPSSCMLCNASVRGRKPLCLRCETALPWHDNACLHCAMPLESSGHVCGECLQQPPVFQHACCAFRYEEPVAGLLNRYKHDRKLHCGYWMAHSASRAIADHYQRHNILLPDCIMPVPLHWRRVQKRGFDQGLEIANVMARVLQLPLQATLQRTRNTGSQQGLSREQRQHNLDGAFALRKPVTYRAVALVDDVLTTGSTVSEIARLLHRSGVAQVHVWAIARTP
ncbi:MAG TPA: ComF family protein [Pseudomonadales bacterium]|nr:ComF family protein [Pseudomonadales bacterium]